MVALMATLGGKKVAEQQGRRQGSSGNGVGEEKGKKNEFACFC